MIFFFSSNPYLGWELLRQRNHGQQGLLVVLKIGKIVSLYITHFQFFFFDVIGITLTHLLVFKHRLGALDILKEKNFVEAFAICNIHLYPLKWKKGDADLIH